MPHQSYLADVKEQYESFPYPPRDPADELKRLITSVPASLLAINHHCFGGRKDFRSGFRCLVAGGGTGDSTIFLAEQLRHYDAEVVYLDLSGASREVAEARARVRQLTNISWVTASIMELPKLGLGEFDYIECTGVLHHLESTEDGLRALNAVLRESGAIFLMLYGKYGRQSVYDMQTLLRSYLPAGLGMREKIQMTRHLLNGLPKSNSFIRDLTAWNFEIAESGFGDAGLYDLLLHSQDRCFDVPGVYALAQSAGLHVLSFAWRADAYDPLNHLDNGSVRGLVGTMDLRQRQALAELLVGDIRMHEFFLARQPDRGARLSDGSMALRSYGSLLSNAARLAAEMAPGPGVIAQCTDQFYTLDIPCTPVSKIVYASMNGATSISALRKHLSTALPAVSPEEIDQELKQIYAQLHSRGYLYLLNAGGYGVTIPDYEKLLAGSRPAAVDQAP